VREASSWASVTSLKAEFQAGEWMGQEMRRSPLVPARPSVESVKLRDIEEVIENLAAS
jgi:hypothetical protein